MTRRALLAVVLVSSSLGFAHAALTTEAPSRTTVERFEDGSGVETRDGRVVRTFDAGTFPWDCTTQGNRECGAPGKADDR